MSRIAYVGLSGPIGYDYKNINEFKGEFPNPILEAPIGLFTLYDKVTFLHPSVCPKSLRKLPFIEFLSDRENLSEYFLKIDENVKNLEKSTNYQFDESIYKQHHKILETIAPFSTWDNHSRQYEGLPTVPNAFERVNIIYDNIISKNEKFNFTTNSLLYKTLNKQAFNISKERITDFLILKHLPNIVDKNGPSVDLIEKIRDRNNVKEFRQKIDSIVQTNNYESLVELSNAVEKEYEEIKIFFLERNISRSYIYNSTLHILKFIASSVIPYGDIVSSFYELVEDLRSIHKDKEFAWTGFLADLRHV